MESPTVPVSVRSAFCRSSRSSFAVTLLLVGLAGLFPFVGAARVEGSQQVTPTSSALDRYARGEHEAAVKAVIEPRLTVGTLTAETTAWVGAVPTDAPRRSLVAAAFALDLAWISTRDRNANFPATFDPSGSRSDSSNVSISSQQAPLPIVTWAARFLPTSGPVSAAERAWWLASVALLEDTAVSRAMEAHLVRARQRISDEPRWRLAEAIARARPKLGSGARRDDPWLTGTQHLRAEQAPAGSDISGAAREFANVASDTTQPALAAEAETYLGWLELKRKKWAAAIPHFARARQLATEPFLLATADYLAGFVHEQLAQPREAIAAYRRAHAIAPDVHNVATRLAALLYVDNQREEAYRILQAAGKSDPEPNDLLALFLRGDARFLAGHIAAMRAALPAALR